MATFITVTNGTLYLFICLIYKHSRACVPAFGSDNGKTTISHEKIYFFRVLSEILCQQFCSCSKKLVELTHFSDGSIKMVLIKIRLRRLQYIGSVLLQLYPNFLNLV